MGKKNYMTEIERKTYTTEEVHLMSGLSIYTIRVQVRNGTFPIRPVSGGGKKGSGMLFPKKAVDEWLDGKLSLESAIAGASQN